MSYCVIAIVAATNAEMAPIQVTVSIAAGTAVKSG